MQYTIKNIPERLDREVRETAHRTGKSVEQVVLECLLHAFGVAEKAPTKRSLADIAGTWVEDRAVNDVLEAQRSVDEDLWK